jgi:hypothetical protein
MAKNVMLFVIKIFISLRLWNLFGPIDWCTFVLEGGKFLFVNFLFIRHRNEHSL